MHLPIYLSIHPSMHPSIHPSLYPCIHVSPLVPDTDTLADCSTTLWSEKDHFLVLQLAFPHHQGTWNPHPAKLIKASAARPHRVGLGVWHANAILHNLPRFFLMWHSQRIDFHLSYHPQNHHKHPQMGSIKPSPKWYVGLLLAFPHSGIPWI